MNIHDGVACVHRACLSHKTYPCPFCGRIAGRALTHVEKIAKAAMESFGLQLEEAWFPACVKAIEPFVMDARVVEPIHRRFLTFDTSLMNTEEEAKRLGEVLSRDMSGIASASANSSRPITLKIEPRQWLQMPSDYPKRVNWLKVISAVLWAPFRFVAEVFKGIDSLERDIGTGLK